MRSSQSHGRLFGILLVIGIPLCLTFFAGIWVSYRIELLRKNSDDQKQLKQITVQTQLLKENVLQELESVRMEVQNLAQVHEVKPLVPPAIPRGRILHYAEFETKKGQILGIKQFARNPLWATHATFDESYLTAAKREIDLSQLHSNQIGMIQVKQVHQKGQDWLTFVFAGAGSDSSLFLVLLDPKQFFSSIHTWASHSGGGKTRSYIVGEQGRVLAHSQRDLVFADLSHTELFQGSIRKVIQGDWIVGSGNYTGVDRQPIRAAFARLGQLPLAVVVEEKDTFVTLGNSVLDHLLEWILYLGFALIWVGGMAVGCAFVLHRYLVKVVTLTVRAQPLADRPPPEPEKREKGRFFSGDEYLVLDSMKTLDKRGDDP